VEKIDLDGPGDIVHAVAVDRVGIGTDRVLADPDVCRQVVEVQPADGREGQPRRSLRH
jgi:hypothetical protein